MSQGGNVPPFGDKESEDAAFNITYIDNVRNPLREKMNNPNEQQNLDIIPPPTMRASTLEPESGKDDVVSGVGSLRKTFHHSNLVVGMRTIQLMLMDILTSLINYGRKSRVGTRQDRCMTILSLRKHGRKSIKMGRTSRFRATHSRCSDSSEDQSDPRTPDQQGIIYTETCQNANRPSNRRRIRREESTEVMKNPDFNGGQDKGNPSDVFTSGNIINPDNFRNSPDSSEDQSDPRSPEQQGNIPKKRRWFQLWRKK